MSPERWRKVGELYNEVLELTSQQRAALLSAADADLRAEVESLLAQNSEGLLDRSLVSADSSIERLPAGTQLGAYRIEAALGAGGMGEVYRARDQRLGRTVALKVLAAHLSRSPDLRERLEREARILSSLNHPHICTLYDIGCEGETFYLVMEYLEGETLRERLKRGAFSISELLQLAIQVADSLDVAHRAGAIHRDVKPENIFLTTRGQPKLLDFGIAKQRLPIRTQDSKTPSPILQEITGSGIVVGTEAYMSPEQARGQEVDPRTDIFSFGVVLYEVATGVRPFQGETSPILFDAILNRTPPPPSRCSANLPGELDHIILKTLEKDRDLRFQTMAEVCERLKCVKDALDGGKTVVPHRPTRSKPRRNPVWRLIALICALMMSLAVLTLYFRDRSGQKIDSLAILPFTNAAGDSNKEYLSDGIAENLINSLSQLPRLRVAARALAFRYRGSQVDPQQAGRDLHVRAVLTGSLAEHDGDLSIQADLVRVDDGSQIWGRQYNGKFTDILGLQQEIAQEVAGKLQLRPTADEQKKLAKRSTDSTEAYQLYLKGRYYWDRRTELTLKRAVDYFEQAIQKDPGYALAYAALADCYAVFAGHEVAAPAMAMPKARAAATKALQLDNTLAGAHAALGFTVMQYEWDWAAAEREFHQSIRYDADYATAYHWYGVFLSLTGRIDEGIAALKRAQQLEPLSLMISASLGRELYHARRYDEAIDEMRKALEMDANFAALHWWLGLPYEQKGMHQDAIEEFRTASRLSKGNPSALGALGHAYAAAGQRQKALQILADLRELARQRYVAPFEISLIYAGLGDNGHVWEWLEAALEDRSWGVMFLKVDPRFDHLRADPRFHDLLRRMRLES